MNESITRVVFIGPSVTAGALDDPPADTVFLPPVKRGAVDDAVNRYPDLRSIGIVDGEFFQSFSISPKEILRSMDRGKIFYGSSSMGALRAAELDIYGMRGIGAIYRMYASGEIDADDEVAMTFDPSTLKAVSEPLVNMRIALERARQWGAIEAEVATKAISAIKPVYYPQRSYRALLHHAAQVLDAAELEQLAGVCANPPSAKTEDAMELLSAMEIQTVTRSSSR